MENIFKSEFKISNKKGPGSTFPISGAAKMNPMKVVNPSKLVRPQIVFKGQKPTSIMGKKH